MKLTAIETMKRELDLYFQSRGYTINWDKYLELEKQQIIEAHGTKFEKQNDGSYDWNSGLKYFNKKYKAQKDSQQAELFKNTNT